MKFMMIILLLIGIKAYAQNNSLTVISNQEGSPSEMKLTELKSIFMAEKKNWDNGKKIVIALMKTYSEIGKKIGEKIYNMKGDDVNKFWLELVFNGSAEPPIFLIP